MSIILGCLKKSKQPIIEKDFQKAMNLSKIGEPDVSHFICRNSFALGCHLLKTTPEAINEKLPYYDASSKCSITADARIDYRSELINRLGGSGEFYNDCPDSLLILKAYLKWGSKCVSYLYGDFAFVIWDERKELLFCARDHFGCRPLYYFENDDVFVFSSTLGGIMNLIDKAFKIDDQFIVDCLIDVIDSKRKTPYHDIFGLEPSHTLTIYSNSKNSIEKYWDLKDVIKIASINEQEAIKEFRNRLQKSIEQRLRSVSSVGAELSGGLDSSGIVRIASAILSNSKVDLITFSQALSEKQRHENFPFRDDRKNIESVIKRSRISKHFYITAENEPGSLNSLIKSMKLYSKPIVQLYPVLSDLLYDEARQQGVKVLLSGFGGDEGVTYKGAGYFEELLMLNRWGQFRDQLTKKIKKNGGSYFRSYLKAFLIKLWPNIIEILRNWGITNDYRRKKYRYYALNKDVSRNHNAKQRYFDLMGVPLDNQMSIRQYKRISHSHIPDRLEGSYLSALSRGIEYRYPLLDVKLLEYYFSLPSDLKYKNGFGRYIFRQSMKGFLPEQIRLREDKLGSSIPNSQYRFMLDEEAFRKLIVEAEKRNEFHYIDYRALQKMADRLVERNTKRQSDIGPRIFLSYMSVIISQKWQREGQIDIGIKC